MDMTATRSRKPPTALTLRRYHRWASAGAGAVLAWVSVTGVALGIDVWASGRKHPAAQEASGPLPRADAARWLEQAAQRLARDPAAAKAGSASLVLRMTADGPRIAATLAVTPREARQALEIDPAADRLLSRKALPPELRAPPWRSALHRLLEDLHRGTIIGLPGQALSLLAGLSFMFLAGSGLWIYLDMWRKRRRAGKSGLVWRV